MQHLYPSLFENEYLKESHIAEVKLPLIVGNTWKFEYLPHVLDVLNINNDYKFIYAIRGYPTVNDFTVKDVFSFLTADTLHLLKTDPKTVFIFDTSLEGHDATGPQTSFCQMLERACDKHQIDHSKILIISGNIRDTRNVINYAEQRKIKPFTTLVMDWLEWPTFTLPYQWLMDTEQLWQATEYIFKLNYDGVYFSNLSRLHRAHRLFSAYMFYTNLKDKCLLSHPGLDPEYVFASVHAYLRMHPELQKELDPKIVKQFARATPLVIDQQDFDINWASSTIPFRHIHDRTLFHVVSETLANGDGQSEFFITEKTYRAISCFIPFIIWGHPGVHEYLKNKGYILYDCFDYSFDTETDEASRFFKLYNEVKKLCDYLDTLTYDEQVEWRLKYKDVAIHNYNVLVKNSMDRPHVVKSEIEKFLSNIN